MLEVVTVVITAIALIWFFYPEWIFHLGISALRKFGRLNQKIVCVNGDEWPYLVGGPADGETLVLLHGFGADKDNWALYDIIRNAFDEENDDGR